MTNKELVERILKSDRELVMEAARFLAQGLVGSSERLPEAKGLAATLASKPFAHVEEIEKLSRAVLLAAAQDDELKGKVESALAGAGRKQFILGGAEIVALAAIGSVALSALARKGKGKETETTTVTLEDNRVIVTVAKTTEPISIGGDLAAILKAFFGGTR